MTDTRKHTYLRMFTAAGVALALLAAGCGGDDDNDTRSADGDPDSEYCNAVTAWAVHEFEGDGDDIAGDPAALEKYWGEYVQFLEDGTAQAPESIRDEWVTYSEVPKVQLTALFEKYDYDVARMEAEGTDEEKALSEPNAEQAAAQDVTNEYDSRVCGAFFPPAADVSFDGAEANAGYCDAVAAFNDAGDQEVHAQAMAPEALRTFLTSDAYAQLLEAIETNAPAEIDEDVVAFIAWTRTEWTDVVQKYDYDFRKVMFDGTTAERATLNYDDPGIADHYARTAAYEEQVCGAES